MSNSNQNDETMNGKSDEGMPVLLFTGFLGSGKTKFIQEALEGEDFNDESDRTLLLVCESGELDYDPSKFTGKNVFIEKIGSEPELNLENLQSFEKKYDFDRVIIEYNGMWRMDRLYEAMPEKWMIVQEMTFADAQTFLMFNQNMRQQTFEKLTTAELVVFNRCVRNEQFDDFKMQAHKIVRVANRNSQILFEFGPSDILMDDIEDPLPYNLEQEGTIDIHDDWFAEWYRDCNENPEKYDGKTFRIKGRVAIGGGMANDELVFGRHVMTCCVQDIQFAGLFGKWTDEAAKLQNGQWVKVKFIVKNEFADIYGESGPVLYIKTLAPCEPTDPEVATF